MKPLITSHIGPVVALVALWAGAADTATAGQFRPQGGQICYDGDFTIVACGSAADVSSGSGSGSSTPGSESRQKVEGDPHDTSDSWFCRLCHVNTTTEVAGPRVLGKAVTADAAAFWRRHDLIATRVVNKRVLTNLRPTSTLSPTLQRLMAARRRR